MRLSHRRASFVIGAAALVGVGACTNKSSQPMDDGLKQDLAAVAPSALEMAPSSATPQLVVSSVEAGPEGAPAPAAHKIVPKPTPKPAPHIAAPKNETAPAPAPQPVQMAPAPSAPAPRTEPAPLPPVEPPPLPPDTRHSQERQKGVYKTEGQIFQQMPWIKP